MNTTRECRGLLPNFHNIFSSFPTYPCFCLWQGYMQRTKVRLLGARRKREKGLPSHLRAGNKKSIQSKLFRRVIASVFTHYSAQGNSRNKRSGSFIQFWERRFFCWTFSGSRFFFVRVSSRARRESALFPGRGGVRHEGAGADAGSSRAQSGTSRVRAASSELC